VGETIETHEGRVVSGSASGTTIAVRPGPARARELGRGSDRAGRALASARASVGRSSYARSRPRLHLRAWTRPLAPSTFARSQAHWSATCPGELVVDGDRGTLVVETHGLVWGLELPPPSEEPSNDRSTHWRLEPDADVVLAGQLGGGERLRARGVESLLIVASRTPKLLERMQRGL
jgi:hypothetical protein